jgi:SAM-dependent methyltransferase
MTLYEIGRLLAEPALPPLYKQVRRRLRKLIGSVGHRPKLLDVGGRKSPYTIGLTAKITVLDLPRESEIQKKLNLGINDGIIEQIKARRSNVEAVVIDDMTDSQLQDESFDLVVSVEVLEHVEEDDKFVSEVRRVLRNGGKFLMTTPNGDWVENKNPDHKRHYKKHQLEALLQKHFDKVHVDYAIAGGRFRKIGLRPWSVSKPTSIAMGAAANVVNSIQSTRPRISSTAKGTHHLIAVAEVSSGMAHRSE